ncbi:MAG: hypothetical protein UT02_C0047G0010 [Parcubacteria group bacterium GW2011_GWC2_38_7]|nr:MAG: hypothetical protein UT02_C0047G0010 [Parcubacteria group bacterium GW2011_GWC2_38_7]
MKKLLLILLILTSCFFARPLFAETEYAPVVQTELKLIAEVGEDRNVVFGRQIVFSAFKSTLPENVKKINYAWSFGDGTYQSGPEVIHIYDAIGDYKVKLLITAEVDGRNILAEDEMSVSVNSQVFVLVVDQSVKTEQIDTWKEYARAQKTAVVVVRTENKDLDLVAEKELVQALVNREEDLRQATAIIVKTDKNIGLSALLSTIQKFNETQATLNYSSSKYVVVLTDDNFLGVSRIGQSIYNVLQPSFVVLTRTSAGSDVFSTFDVEKLLQKLRTSETDFRLLGVHSQRTISSIQFWNVLSFLVGYMVDEGVPLNSIYLILILPIIATIVAFTRQIIGFKSLGIYTPSIIAVLFLYTGLKYGLAIFFLTLIVGTLGRLIARKIKIAYLPRMAMVLTLIFLSVFAAFVVGAFFHKTGLLEMTVFPILVMVLLTEKFISVQIERGNKAAAMLVLETLVLVVACYFLANWQMLKTFVLSYPEVVLFTLLINYLVGKWTGLRLFEMYRFRKVIKNVELAEKK